MKAKAAIPAGALVIAGFLAALYALLGLQYQSGENFPPYSSLRKDPLGTSALYEALSALPDIDATRNRLPLREWDPSTKATLILAGADPDLALDKDAATQLEGFVAGGGRLIIAFRDGPSSRATADASETPDEDEEGQPAEEAETQTDKQDKGAPPESGGDEDPSAQALAQFSGEYLDERWEFAFTSDERGVTLGDAKGYLVTRTEHGPATLPDPLAWRGALAFTDWNDHWVPVYARGDERAAILLRPWGRGAVVLASNSYLLSNEALRLEREPAFLTWLVGPRRRVVFDESHLGLSPRMGVMTLARRYGLLPLLAVFGVVFVLFLWRNATSLTPRRTSGTAARELKVEKGASAALTSLLRRSTGRRNLLRICVDTWLHSARWQGRHAAAAQEEVKAAFEQLERETEGKPDPVSGYKRISAVLQERKRGS